MYFLLTEFNGKPSEFGKLYGFLLCTEKMLWKSFVQEVQMSRKSVVSGHLLIMTNNGLAIFYLVF